VTTGRLGVVVGGEVVVVAGGEVVVVVGGKVDFGVDPETAPVSEDVVGDVVVVDVLGVEPVETWAGMVLEEALLPGCSLATTRPMAMAAPVAAMAVERLNRRRRSAARRLFSGVLD
jgi:hypothetical protein